MTDDKQGQDEQRVAEIRARLEAATPGPWQTWPDGTEESVESVSVGRFVCHLNSNMRQFREDAAFIAHAREDVPYLLARLAAAEATMDSPTWPYVLAFARQMEGKLDQNRHKGNREGWLKDAPIDLLARLVEEVVELQHAIDRGWPTDDVDGEAADVANFALMVADAYRHRNGSRAALAGSRERAQGEGSRGE